jgi:protein-S-isoprenylcysteine O-methyltransferase Ste14
MSKKRKFQHYRILLSRFVSIALFLILLFSQRPFLSGIAVDIGYWVGFLFLLTCTLGRLWCLQYLSGFKTKSVIDVGPFSVVRNPLYLFSFIGVIGFMLIANHLWVALVAVAAYLFYYPFVVRSEENHMRQKLGDEFTAYCERIPRFVPDFSNYQEPLHYDLSAKKFSKVYFDVMWFMVGFVLLSLLLKAQAAYPQLILF